VGIAHGHGNIRVSENLIYSHQINSAHHQVG
jgi:hypothetical protein